MSCALINRVCSIVVECQRELHNLAGTLYSQDVNLHSLILWASVFLTAAVEKIVLLCIGLAGESNGKLYEIVPAQVSPQ